MLSRKGSMVVLFLIAFVNLLVFYSILRYTSYGTRDIFIMVFAVIGMCVMGIAHFVKENALVLGYSKENLFLYSHYMFYMSMLLIGFMSSNKVLMLYGLYLVNMATTMKLMNDGCIYNQLHDNNWVAGNWVLDDYVNEIQAEHVSITLNTVIIGRLVYMEFKK